jgi:hypothetical protein
MRPWSTTSRPYVDVPSPMAISAGPSVNLVAVKSLHVQARRALRHDTRTAPQADCGSTLDMREATIICRLSSRHGIAYFQRVQHFLRRQSFVIDEACEPRPSHGSSRRYRSASRPRSYESFHRRRRHRRSLGAAKRRAPGIHHCTSVAEVSKRMASAMKLPLALTCVAVTPIARPPSAYPPSRHKR